jgi:chromosome segregation ATPase
MMLKNHLNGRITALSRRLFVAVFMCSNQYSESKLRDDEADARHQIELLKMKLASANDTIDKSSQARQELAEREVLVHQSLQSQINDLKTQLAAKTKAFEIAEANREAAERRLAAMDAKVIYQTR